MANDLLDTFVKLGNAAVLWRRRTETSRLQVHTASLRLLPGRRPVCLRLEGPAGSVVLEISRVAFWRLTSEFHERSIAADTHPKQPPRRPRGKRS